MPISRIETLQAVMQGSPPGNNPVFTSQDMKKEVKNYWGSEANEKLFPLPFWRGEALLRASPSGQIAFKVTNIDSSSLVEATWISYDPSNPKIDASDNPGGVIGYFRNLIETLKRNLGSDPPVSLFVFGEELFPLNGGTGLKQFLPHHKMTILGRIGKPDDGIPGAFILAGGIEIKIPGTGGPGGTTGARLPPGGDT